MTDDGASVVRAALADVGRITLPLARAFQNDPLMRFAIPDDNQRRRLAPRLIALNARYGCRYGEVYAAPNVYGGYVGAAVWLPPGHTSMTLARILRAGLFVAPFRVPWPILRRLAIAGNHAASLHARCLTKPYWYLSQLGVEPAAQRRGVASRLLRPMLARMDAANLPCYLETENAANIAFYQRFGFHVAAEDTSPGYPPIWGMVRPGSPSPREEKGAGG
jgi:GNAT superfamily N-acetyltransferase